MLTARRVIEFVTEITVASVHEKMHDAGSDRKQNCDRVIIFEPTAAWETVRTHRCDRAHLLLDDHFPLDYAEESHH